MAEINAAEAESHGNYGRPDMAAAELVLQLEGDCGPSDDMQGYGWALLSCVPRRPGTFGLRSTKAIRLRRFAMLANLLSDRGQEHPSAVFGCTASRRGFFIYGA